MARTLWIWMGAVLAATGAAAQTLKPGLWQVENRMQGGGQMAEAQANLQQQMANLPPEQRRMVEEMMAKNGVRIAPGGAMAVQACISREMADRSEIPLQQGDCRIGSQQRSGTTLRFTFSCSNPPATGDGQVSFSSPEAYTARMNVSTTVAGRPETVSMQASGKWLSADCGTLRPAR